MALASEDNPYWVRSSVEILYALNELRKSRTPLACEIGRAGDSFTTEILSVDSDSGIILDAPPLQAQLDSALRAGTVRLHTATSGVRIEFELERIATTQWERATVLRASAPARILKIQRRNFFRIPIPKSRSMYCMISTQQGTEPFAYVILDIGLGGVALFSKDGEPDLEEGCAYDKCKIALSDVGTIEPRILVRHVAIIRTTNRPVTRRYGCEFVDLPGPQESAIQRFVLQLERDRRAADLVDS